MDTSRPAPSLPVRTGAVALAAAVLLSVGCAGGESGTSVALGPVDGRDLPPVDTGRVAVGDMAPDFALEAYGDSVVRLSDYRGEKEVILVFYRGHW